MKWITQCAALRASRAAKRPRWWPAARRQIVAGAEIVVRSGLDRQHIVRCGYFVVGMLMWRIDLRGLDAEEIASLIAGERSA